MSVIKICTAVIERMHYSIFRFQMMDNTQYTFMPFHIKLDLVASVCNTKTLDTDSIFIQPMTKEMLVNTVSFQIQSFF